MDNTSDTKRAAFNIVTADDRDFTEMSANDQRHAALAQVNHDGRFGFAVGCNGPECLPYLYAMQQELSEWMLKVSREIATFEAQRKAIEEGANL